MESFRNRDCRLEKQGQEDDDGAALGAVRAVAAAGNDYDSVGDSAAQSDVARERLDCASYSTHPRHSPGRNRPIERRKLSCNQLSP